MWFQSLQMAFRSPVQHQQMSMILYVYMNIFFWGDTWLSWILKGVYESSLKKSFQGHRWTDTEKMWRSKVTYRWGLDNSGVEEGVPEPWGSRSVILFSLCGPLHGVKAMAGKTASTSAHTWHRVSGAQRAVFVAMHL